MTPRLIEGGQLIELRFLLDTGVIDGAEFDRERKKLFVLSAADEAIEAQNREADPPDTRRRPKRLRNSAHADDDEETPWWGWVAAIALAISIGVAVYIIAKALGASDGTAGSIGFVAALFTEAFMWVGLIVWAVVATLWASLTGRGADAESGPQRLR